MTSEQATSGGIRQQLWDIGIIAGGPGVLITAYSLLKLASAPVNITLFEASSRLGGKTRTPRFQAAPVSYEAGAAEFYDYSVFEEDSLKALIRELGLSVVRIMASTSVDWISTHDNTGWT